MNTAYFKQSSREAPRNNLREQPEKLGNFIHEYDFDSQHQGIYMKYPSKLSKPSCRIYKSFSKFFIYFRIKQSGHSVWAHLRAKDESESEYCVCWARGGNYGNRQRDLGRHILDYDLGYFDEELEEWNQ